MMLSALLRPMLSTTEVKPVCRMMIMMMMMMMMNDDDDDVVEVIRIEGRKKSGLEIRVYLVSYYMQYVCIYVCMYVCM